MNKEKLRKNWKRMAVIGSALILACAMSVSLRSAPSAPQNDTQTSSAIGGPVQLMRGQKIRFSAFVPAALRGKPKTLELRFAIMFMREQWTVVGKSFEVDHDCPWGSVELQVMTNGDVVFEQQTIGTLPAGVTSIDVAGHEMSHGLTGNSPATASALEVGDSETGATRYALTVSQGGGIY